MKKIISSIVCLIASLALLQAGAPGEDLYKAKCVMCHGADGGGKTPMGLKFKIRDLHSADVQKQSDDELTAIISIGKTPMPAYGKSLTKGEIKDLVAYVRGMAPKA